MPACLLFLATATAHMVAPYPVDLSATGLAFAGVGAQSTAGSARLLIDYPAPQRDAVLDFLFKPQFGASLQHLKVEIGGDAQCVPLLFPTRARLHRLSYSA
jgi:galactosylceramidase